SLRSRRRRVGCRTGGHQQQCSQEEAACRTCGTKVVGFHPLPFLMRSAGGQTTRLNSSLVALARGGVKKKLNRRRRPVGFNHPWYNTVARATSRVLPKEGRTMIDQTTGLPMRVSPQETIGPYIRLPYDQVDDVRRLLDSHGIRHWVQDSILSLN